MRKRELVTRIVEAAPIRVRPLLRRLLRAPASGGVVRPGMPLILGIDAGSYEEVSVMWKRHSDGRLEIVSLAPRAGEVPILSPWPVVSVENLYVGDKRVDLGPYTTTGEEALRAARRARIREAASYVPSYEREARGWSHAELARMMAVPPSMLRPGDQSPFKALEELKRETMLDGLKAHVRWIDRKLMRQLMPERSRRAEEAVILLTYRLRQKAFGAQWIELSRRYADRQAAYAAKHGATYDVRRASAFVDHVVRFMT